LDQHDQFYSLRCIFFRDENEDHAHAKTRNIPSDALIAELSMARPGHPASTASANKRLFYKRQDWHHGPKYLDEIDKDQTLEEDENRQKKEIRLSEMDMQAALIPLSSYTSAVGKFRPPHLQKDRSNNRRESHDDPRSSQA
jgi:hypothetical protein